MTAAITFLVIVAFIPSDASLSAIYVCVALFGGTIIPTYSIVIAHVNDGVTPGEFVAASGGLLIVQGVGATVGPIVAGLAMSVAERRLSITIITAQLVIALWGAYRFSIPAGFAHPIIHSIHTAMRIAKPRQAVQANHFAR